MKNINKFDWFMEGYYDWIVRKWNPPTNPKAFKSYCRGYDYIWGENAEEMYDYFGFIY